MSVVNNERVKLTANALDRASTASLTVGVIGPTVAALYGFGPTSAAPQLILLLLGSSFWLIVAAILHVIARHVLGRLK